MPVARVIHILTPTVPLLDGDLSLDLLRLLRASGSSKTFRNVMTGISYKTMVVSLTWQVTKLGHLVK